MAGLMNHSECPIRLLRSPWFRWVSIGLGSLSILLVVGVLVAWNYGDKRSWIDECMICGAERSHLEFLGADWASTEWATELSDWLGSALPVHPHAWSMSPGSLHHQAWVGAECITFVCGAPRVPQQLYDRREWPGYPIEKVVAEYGADVRVLGGDKAVEQWEMRLFNEVFVVPTGDR